MNIRVDPADVRLIPNVNTSYGWKAAPSIKQLLKTQLSKHSTGAYKMLCQAVDDKSETKLLQAVLAEEMIQGDNQTDNEFKKDTSCNRNEKCEEVVQWKLQVASEVMRRELAEKTMMNLKRLSEEQQDKIIHLEEEVQRLLSMTKFFQQTIDQWLQGVTEAISLLQTAHSELLSVAQSSS